MTFVSYAQNFEDVMLWRALGHVEKGFYIDVGAFSPDIESVTRAFYDRGWRGINIEPNPKYLAELNTRRPEDKNLGVAVSDVDGTATLHVMEDPGLTTVQPEIAKTHQETGLSSEVIEVTLLTLSTIWQEQVPPFCQVHFLKIDVEGSEGAVLRGLDWTHFRPWIVVVEATSPMSQREVHKDWEKVLLDADYRVAYWDGLNRFYVAKEHSDLLGAFSAPPNVFDDFVLARSIDPAPQLESQLDKEVEKHRAAEEKLIVLTTELEMARDTIDYLSSQPICRSLFFRSGGRPKKALRLLLFHENGKPRTIFKRLVLHKNGRPRRAFRKWMQSDQYLALPQAVRWRPQPSLTPRGEDFMTRLKAAQSRRRGK